MARENSGPEKLRSEAALRTQSWLATADAKSLKPGCATGAGQHFNRGRRRDWRRYRLAFGSADFDNTVCFAPPGFWLVQLGLGPVASLLQVVDPHGVGSIPV